jgi:diguanylate cyclase
VLKFLHRLLMPFAVALLFGALVLAVPAAHAQVVPADGTGPVLTLADTEPRIRAWPALRLLVEPEDQAWTLADAQARAAQLRWPQTAADSLGVHPTPVWLHVPLRVADTSDGAWVLDLPYASLRHITAYVLDAQGRVVQQAVMGSNVAIDERPLQARTPAMQMQLQPGERYTLWLRVKSAGPMVMPLHLSKVNGFLASTLAEQTLQGLLAGVALTLVLYSLIQWWTLRDSLYLKYAMLAAASAMFSVAQFGLGAQYLWPHTPWFELHAAGLAALIASGSTFLFVMHVLRDLPHYRWYRPTMQAGAALLFGLALAFALDLIHVRVALAAVGTVGLLPCLLGVPGALTLARRRDPVGPTLIAAWIAYFLCSALFVAMLRGKLPANGWTMHLFQFGATFDMILFMRVVALRARVARQEGQRAAHERDLLREMALTDALTGLLNRRGLTTALEGLLAHGDPQRLTAVYMLDLNGFKQVNDNHGHAVGDRLLAAVGQRLRNSLRATDVLARHGGDEFVVAVGGLASIEQAEHLAQQVTRAFDAPFVLPEGNFTLGSAVGCSLAPRDGATADVLIQSADTEMYRHKSRHPTGPAGPTGIGAAAAPRSQPSTLSDRS